MGFNSVFKGLIWYSKGIQNKHMPN